MGLESGTYISDLVATNPTATDPKSQGDDHLRLLKSTIQATFPNVTGAVTPTHTELNHVDGVTSPIQAQIDGKGAIAGQAWTGAHDFTGGSIAVPTASAGDNTTKAASTAYVDAADALKANLASPTFTGTPAAPTAAPGTNTTQIATTAFVDAAAFASALPSQTGNAGKFVTTDGSTASWANLLDLKAAKSSNYPVATTDRYAHFVLTSTATLTLLAAATAGDGFRFWVRNDGTGVWTIDPDSTEQIDGLGTIKVYPGEAFAVICDGTGWRTFGRGRGPILISATSIGGTPSSVDCETGFDDTEFTRFMIVGEGVSATAGVTFALRVKKGGAYVTGTTYFYRQGDNTQVNTATNIAFGLTNAAAGTISFLVDIVSPFTANQMISARSASVSTSGSGVNAGDDVIARESTASAMQGIRVYPTSDNLDAGVIRFYGFR